MGSGGAQLQSSATKWLPEKWEGFFDYTLLGLTIASTHAGYHTALLPWRLLCTSGEVLDWGVAMCLLAALKPLMALRNF